MSKYLYRMWIPQANIHGDCFDKICEECQGKIEEELDSGFYLPTTVGIDTSVGLGIKFGFKFSLVELCDKCAKAFKEWVSSRSHFSFCDESIQLWRSIKDEVKP